MRDNIITNVISIMYSAMISFLSFIFFFLFLIYGILQNGLLLDEIDTPSIKIKQLYIKLNEKLDISAKEISIYNNSSNSADIDVKNIEKYIHKISTSTKWLSSIYIEDIRYNDISATFRYKNDDDGFLYLKTPIYDLNSTINLEKNILHLQVERFSYKDNDLESTGDIYLDTNKVKLYTKLNLSIKNSAKFDIYLSSDLNKLSYKIISLQDIKSIKPILSMIKIPKEVNFWINDAIEMNYLDIKSFYGYVDYSNVSDALKNLYVYAVIDKLNYTYNINLDSIHTKETYLEFKNGILYIRPQKHSSYNIPLGDSWLYIDFLKKEELLTLYLLFDAKLNKDILKILSTYKIDLPFVQKSGDVKTDLKIQVGLRNIDVDAHGNFYVKKGMFNLFGLDVNLSNAKIRLDNYKASIKGMSASYEDIAKAKVDFIYEANKHKGYIDFYTRDISYLSAKLKTDKKPLHIRYTIDKNQDMIDVDKSSWVVADKQVDIDKISLPFDINNPVITLPATYFNINSISNGFISGDIDIKNIKADLHIDLLKFKYDGVTSSSTNTPLNIKYDKKLSVFSTKKIYFKVNGSKCTADNFYMSYIDNIIKIKHTNLKFGDIIDTKIYAKYDLNTNKSHISLSRFDMKNPDSGKTIYKNNKLLLSLVVDNDKIEVKSKELNAEFYSKDGQWQLSLKSLGRVANNLQLLKDYSLTNGDITFYKKENENYTRFLSHIKYQYPIIVQNNKLIKNYHLEGKIYKNKIFTKINNDISINIKNNINISINNCGINIQSIQEALKSIKTDSSAKDTKSINIHSKDSYLYISKTRKAIFNTVKLQYYDDILTAQLKHKNGYAGLKIEGDKLNLYGKNFNDEFMNKLFSLSKFKHGVLDFSIKGSIDDYNGLFLISNTTIVDYKILNNILAFINTVPSLVTFNIPGYNKHGLYVQKAYMKLHAKDGDLAVSDVYLHSKELDILGNGNVNIEKNSIDLTLNLKTDLGSDLSKIPIVGYILLDKDTISTTLKIDGKLNNPTVKSMAAKEIIVAPFNIIKRTLTLPYKLLKDAEKL